MPFINPILLLISSGALAFAVLVIASPRNARWLATVLLSHAFAMEAYRLAYAERRREKVA